MNHPGTCGLEHLEGCVLPSLGLGPRVEQSFPTSLFKFFFSLAFFGVIQIPSSTQPVFVLAYSNAFADLPG